MDGVACAAHAILVSAYAMPPLTTVAVDKTQMGREAARMLVEKLKSADRLLALRK
jgi:DNA-binding LacI/PurR family transcriptional regulator